eukprot:1186581-Prorocentrum_minimum.AAC.1
MWGVGGGVHHGAADAGEDDEDGRDAVADDDDADDNADDNADDAVEAHALVREEAHALSEALHLLTRRSILTPFCQVPSNSRQQSDFREHCLQ